MTDQQYKDLETWAQRELETLPRHRAPDELAQRVVRAIALRHHRAHLRPAGWAPRTRLAAAALCLASLAVFAGVAMTNEVPFVTAASESLRHAFASAAAWLPNVFILGDAAVLVLRKVGHPALLAALVVFSALAAICAGIGTACFRFVTTEQEI